jgi:uncharacterized protein
MKYLKQLILWGLLTTAGNLLAIPIPELTRRVTDLSHILSDNAIARIESQLKAHEEATSNQIAVLTVPSLEGDSIEEVAVKVFESWKLGQKSKSNGVLLLVAPNERKMRIEVGYGLEGSLTDLQASRIVKKIIRPKFKAGDMDGGIEDGVSAIIATIQGEYKPESSDVNTSSASSDSQGSAISRIVIGIGFLVFGFIIPGFVSFIFLIFSLQFLHAGLAMLLSSFIASVLVVVLIVLFLIIKFFARGESSGGSSDGGFFGGGGFYSGGSSSSDSWSSSGSDSWGGGGGDSGGGGSSGDW